MVSNPRRAGSGSVSAGPERPRNRPPLSHRRWAAIAVVAAATVGTIALLAWPGQPTARSQASYRTGTSVATIPALTTTPRGSRPALIAPTTTQPPAVPAALAPASLDLQAPAVAVPLELQLPTISKQASMLAVGITPAGAMEAPMGKADDPNWQQVFWYRGSAIPGAASTAIIAGHVSDPLGRPGVFAHIDALRPGDPIGVRDLRTGLDMRFRVDDVGTYPLTEAATDPAVLARIYGTGPVAGHGPQRSADGQAHLTLITCAGTFVNGTHDHRFVVFATRVT
jgi:hypothetical protein